MDGTNRTAFVPRGLSSPAGVAIDHSTRRLYWADWGAKVIQYSSLDGSQVITVSHATSAPWGIALSGQRLYWSLKDGENRVISSARMGGEIRVMYSGSVPITHLAVQDSTVTKSRGNDCHGVRDCDDGVCVLTPASFTCLPKI